MDQTGILTYVGPAVYVALGAVALYGIFCVILLVRRIAEKRFSNTAQTEQFFEDVRQHLAQRDFDAVSELCDTPPFWSKAVPQLILVALPNREEGTAKLRRLLGEKFERDILGDLEYRMSWIGTIVKSAPMLGLLGTVIGMINAFAKISGAEASGVDPRTLADDISFALFTTALGLMIAIPLVLAGNMIHVRIGKMQDSVQQDLGEFLDDLNRATVAGGERTS